MNKFNSHIHERDDVEQYAIVENNPTFRCEIMLYAFGGFSDESGNIHFHKNGWTGRIFGDSLSIRTAMQPTYNVELYGVIQAVRWDPPSAKVYLNDKEFKSFQELESVAVHRGDVLRATCEEQSLKTFAFEAVVLVPIVSEITL